MSVVFDQANEAGIKIGELNPEKCGYIAIQQLKEERDRVLNAIDEVEKVAREFEQLKENPFGDVREDGKHFLADFFDHAGPGAKAVQTDYDAIAEYMAKLAKVDALLGSHYDEYFEQAAELTAFEAKSKYEELQVRPFIIIISISINIKAKAEGYLCRSRRTRSSTRSCRRASRPCS